MMYEDERTFQSLTPGVRCYTCDAPVDYRCRTIKANLTVCGRCERALLSPPILPQWR